ncbi:hypothetical protein BH10ACI4_BH10ACI4_11690 [soil metagenome]
MVLSLRVAALAFRLMFLLILFSKPLLRAQSPEFRLDYTGGLFGYYRIEEPLAPGSAGADKVHRAESLPTPVSAFLSYHDPAQIPRNSLLVGMGDNFAPEFGASLQWNEAGDCRLAPSSEPVGTRPKLAPETLYKNEGRFALGLPCDNVARFLLRAGYRAIVPGREDFIYTARWTREMSLMMQQYSKRDQAANLSVDRRIHMLASNLRVPLQVNGSDIAIGTPLLKAAKDKCPLLFAEDLFSERATKCVAGGATELMDWIDRMDRVLDEKTGLKGTLEAATDPAKSLPPPTDREKTLERRQALLINQAAQLQQMLPGVPDKLLPVEKKRALLGELAKFADAKNYKIVPAPKPHGGPDVLRFFPKSDQMERQLDTFVIDCHDLACKTAPQLDSFIKDCHDLVCTFAKELLEVFRGHVSAGGVLLSEQARRDGRDALLRSFSKEQRNVGYTIADSFSWDSSTRSWKPSPTLIIGVVGKETMQEVSPSNLKLCTPALGEQYVPQVLGTCRDAVGGLPAGYNRGFGRIEGSVVVADPVTTVDLLLRALSREQQIQTIDRVLVMAQMPATEAEELGAHLHALAVSRGETDKTLSIDAIVSEAQDDHASAVFETTYMKNGVPPVLTPKHAYTLMSAPKPVRAPIYRASFTATLTAGKVKLISDDATSLANNTRSYSQTPRSTGSLLACEVLSSHPTIELPKNPLKQAIFVNRSTAPRVCDLAPSSRNERQTALIQFLLSRMQLRSHADVTLLQRRDLFLEDLPPGYDDYDVCEYLRTSSDEKLPPSAEEQYCRVHVALDRVLWKGDYSERVMVTGKDLKQILGVAKGLPTQESTLAAQDTRDQWLVNFGVTTPVSTNLTKLDSENNTFFVAQDTACVNDNTLQPGQDSYCVNGQNIVDDRAYWIATNDHLANDSTVYKALAGEPSPYHAPRPTFLTTEITETMVDVHGLPKPIRGPAEDVLTAQLTHQQRPLVHLDYSKLVASFTSLHPQGGNQYVANNFQGASDSRASAASKQDLDLEALARMSFDFPAPSHYFKSAPVSLGIQSDLEYDRTLQGSVTKDKTTGLVPFSTANYTLNNYTVGGFIQIPTSLGRFFPAHFGAGGKSLPRTYLVLAPYQYSRQLVSTPLIYPSASPSPAGNLTLMAPRVTSFLQKFGGRTEWGGGKWWAPDFGSYAEAGGQFGIFNNLPSGVLDPATGTVCSVSTAQSIADCLKIANLPQLGQTALQPLTMTTHTAGLYWDIHISKGIKKKIDRTGPAMSFVFDSKGDYFRKDERPSALSTQTRYDVPLSFSLGFPILQNLTLAPTYAPFLYQNQRDFHSLVVNSFSISARWYFARDSAVPVSKQIVFSGPASTNQSAKTK